jgi:hypothetical protein
MMSRVSASRRAVDLFAGDDGAPPRRFETRLWSPDGCVERAWRGRACASTAVAHVHQRPLWTWPLASRAALVAARDGSELLGIPCP